MKERIKEEVVGSYALPLMLVAKITDKITGSSLAPYYFCKYFVSMHDILESYIEMLKYCRFLRRKDYRAHDWLSSESYLRLDGSPSTSDSLLSVLDRQV